ncbi:hypothetical protein LGH82_27405 [Mesorhizobium sp. PAMC28654]|uniref:hypothetical protein n=1 Tax=Mesorhizobium sp. PAMC28654 TaxID=2880934 RepID=UPI001D0B1BA2|nr:hypothetical protein [Mesorhizobium sp. PAMC28654]UDL88803.1 hypothetical protein LGH82_27405 [Mesorhizobium sp. PAMC28654]
MRQRLLNGALAGALAGLFCLLAATAYTEVRQDDTEANCASGNHALKSQAAGCKTCVAMPCDTSAMAMKNCDRAAACTIDGKLIDRDPKSYRSESRLWAGMQMQP